MREATRPYPHAYACRCQQCRDMARAIVSGAFSHSELERIAVERDVLCECDNCRALRAHYDRQEGKCPVK